MEKPQNLQQAANDNNAQDHPSHYHHHHGGGGGNKALSGNNGNNGNNGGFLCRQSSSRWTPTTDQIRILKELYYTNGMRSPTAEQIQKISARLRQYGKIEGKNVFYWFQNHKARERQKKRFTSDHNHNLHHHYQNHNNPMQRNNVNGNNNNNINNNINNNNNTASDFQAFHHGHMKYSNLYPVVGSVNPSPASVVEINGMNCPYGYDYGGVTNIEKAFREQCGSSGANGGSMAHNLGWVGSVDQYGLFDLRSTIPVDEDQALSPPEIETLPLFPVHGGKINSAGNGGGGYYSSWYTSNQGGGVGHVGSRTSLELSLNCCGRRSPDSIS